MTDDEIGQHYLADALGSFRGHKKLAEKALAQISDEDFFVILDEESNSIAIVMKHMAGNMISRWTDFLTSDGEKPNRNRDMEFVIEPQTTRQQLMDYWKRGWQTVFDAVQPLNADDLGRKVMIRNEEHTVVQAINRQMTHYAYHVGQIVFLAKHFRSREWQSLSVPRNRSAQFNSFMAQQPPRVADKEKQMDAAGQFTAEDAKK